ncbi:MAG TPA: hypothetical protein VF490_04815, partial [Chryseosolibacter sp.]
MRKKVNLSSSIAKKGKKESNGASGHHTDLMASPASRKKQKVPTEILFSGPVAESGRIDELNGMVDSRELLRVLNEVKNGNFSARMPFDQVGVSGKVCDTMNEIISMNDTIIREFMKAGEIIGKQGKLNQRIEISNAKGSWSQGVESLNTLISDLVHPTK